MNDYLWGAAFQAKLLALYIRDPKKALTVVEPGYFTSPVHVDISRIARDAYEGQNTDVVRLSKTTLMALVKQSLGKKRRESWPTYRQAIRDIYDDELLDRKIVFNQALSFAKDQAHRQALVEAERLVNGKQYNKAIAKFRELESFGAERNLGIDYWKGIEDPNRWIEDREGMIGTFFFPRLDWAMQGGLAKKELGLILAGGKKGKSTLLARFAAGAAWLGKNVAIATGELSEEKYRKRIDAMMTLLTTFQMTSIATNMNMTALYRAQAELKRARGFIKGNIYIKEWATGKGTSRDIEVWLDQLKDAGKQIDMLIVDYVRVFKPNYRYEEQRQNIGQVCIDLRGIATERKMPVWTAAQTTRGGINKESIGPEDLAEDISQFWTLDVLIALSQTKAEEEAKKARLMLTSARDFESGIVIPISLNRDTFRVWQDNLVLHAWDKKRKERKEKRK